MAKRRGRTIFLENKPSILGYASAVGKKEHEGPLGDEFDFFTEDSYFGEDSYEKAETKLQKTAMSLALEKANLKEKDIDCAFAGDLLNQCIGSGFGMRDKDIAYIGLYGACSTMGLALGMGSIFIDSGAARKTLSVTSSHFCSAERQYRFPLNYGSQRTPSAQWTVTGSGAVVLGKGENKPYIHSLCFGEIEDFGINDVNNMGAAMAPAAASTLIHYFNDTKTKIEDYDLLFTGDLGEVGSKALYEILEKEGINIRCRHSDCGNIIFDKEAQDVHAGGSGCGCSASVFCSYIMHRLEDKTLKNILFMPTGALMSPTSAFQGETIPSVAHILNIRV